MTEYVNQNPIELYSFVCLLFIYIIILQKEHFSLVLDVLQCILKPQLPKYPIPAVSPLLIL